MTLNILFNFFELGKSGNILIWAQLHNCFSFIVSNLRIGTLLDQKTCPNDSVGCSSIGWKFALSLKFVFYLEKLDWSKCSILSQQHALCMHTFSSCGVSFDGASIFRSVKA